DLAPDLPDLVGAAAVGADALGQDGVADRLLDLGVEGAPDLAATGGEALGELACHLLLERVDLGLAGGLVGVARGRGGLPGYGLVDGLGNLRGDRPLRVVHRR